MTCTSQFHLVSLSAINLADRTYSLTPWEDIPPGEELLNSIKRFGILHPPILQQGENNSYRIVIGKKRVLAAQQLAPNEPVFCRIIPADIKEKVLFSLLLEEAKAATPLTVVEQIVFFEKFLLTAPMDDAIPMLEQMGCKPQKKILTDLLQLRSLGEAALRGMHDGTIHAKTATKLLNLSATDQKVIVQLITGLRFGGSKQQKLIDLCMELSKRKNIPLEQILADFPSADALAQPVNIPQLGAALLAWLHEECFPQLSQAENTFKRQVTRLNLPSIMHVDHTPAFENEETTLSLRFPDWKSLEKVAEGIRTLLQEKN